jgi:predicted RNA-binding protein YlxR (DUF448 family)
VNISVQPSAGKRVPQRTCVACRQVKAKQDLVRIVGTADEGLTIDTTGKKQGRGAYLCKVKNCWESGLKNNRLGYVLHMTLTQQDQQKLIEFAEKL